MTAITVRDWMTTDPITIRGGSSLAEARALMQRHEVGRLLVVDGSGSLVGLVAWSDVMEAWPSPLGPLEPYEVRELMARVAVDEVMATQVVTVDPNTTISEAADGLFEARVGALPVVEEGVVVGILTSTDLLQGLVRVLSSRQ